MARSSNLAAIAGLDAMTALLGSTATLHVFEGTLPATCELADAGTQLSQHSMSATAFQGAIDGTDKATAVANAIGDDTSADATGTAQYWRMKDGVSTVLFQGTVSVTAGGGELQFDSVAFVAGGLVTITGFNLHLWEEDPTP